MKEKWKLFRHGYYEVSNCGRVRRAKPGKNTYVGKILKLFGKNNDRLQVCTTIDYIRKWHLVHRIVARAFIGPCPEGMEVNHKDLNPSNNCVDNLEYVTRQENIEHAIRHGVKWGNGILTVKQVKKIRKLYKTGEYTHGQLGILFKVKGDTIDRIVNRRGWKLNKYKEAA